MFSQRKESSSLIYLHWEGTRSTCCQINVRASILVEFPKPVCHQSTAEGKIKLLLPHWVCRRQAALSIRAGGVYHCFPIENNEHTVRHLLHTSTVRIHRRVWRAASRKSGFQTEHDCLTLSRSRNHRSRFWPSVPMWRVLWTHTLTANVCTAGTSVKARHPRWIG